MQNGGNGERRMKQVERGKKLKVEKVCRQKIKKRNVGNQK
jgi:hypothetical protein